MESPEKSPSFIEREVIPLRNDGELEVFVRQDGEGIFSYLINVRSAEEKSKRESVGNEYYKVLQQKDGLPVTGDGSIEGLIKASHYLKELIPRLRELGAHELWIDGDNVRMDVYEKVLSQEGFESTMRENGGPALVYRF